MDLITQHFERRWFAPSLLAWDQMAARYPEIMQHIPNWHFTAVHVRRGDYIEHQDSFPLCTPHYYESAAKLVRSEYPTTTFLVFSDDVPWCRENMPSIIGPCTILGTEPTPIPMRLRGQPTDHIDLFLGARCHSHILSNSTFAFWQAFLADDREAIRPHPWFGPHVSPSGFPATWRVLSC